MEVIGIIPARYGSTRFPGKPLVDICGKTMLERVYIQAEKSKVLDNLIVATDDRRIAAEVGKFGGNVFITSRQHKSGTDRVAEVVKRLRIPSNTIILNIQGDAPLLHPSMIKDLVRPFHKDKNLVMTALYCRIENPLEVSNPNVVKVLMDKKGFALYFSRFPVPFIRERGTRVTYYKHIGPYAYRKNFILKFSRIKQTLLEKAERLEQLRVLESGYRIKMVRTVHCCPEVDTRQDLKKVIQILRTRRAF